ncbi:glycoside hydrolase family 78 protein [Mahella australiensis]|uniref:alpha-L-rhamnosidase n=1 Tax=Mahella australiensis (strain DSM 15567 / CIP 107919 / 50-1 BON) TaxID=697281 RepID=F3ZVM4_MAHA5|nr:glycoside hydrolase family 78 protein [Mahella australiensis]AEE96386.1 alpha-L-rhamnosidase [Mahella australiensis 50-1 BON]
MMKNASPYAPVELRCEYLVDFLGIDNPKPRFSWLLDHDEKGQYQTAYQIVVADNTQSVGNDEGNVWDSGRVESDNSAGMVYQGQQLKPCTRYFWKVRWWDKNGQISPYSRVAVFETGLMADDNWQAKWIGDKSRQEVVVPGGDGLNQGKGFTLYMGSLFRKEFVLSKKPVRARAYVSGIGYYEMRINGKKVGDRVLEPGQTDYKKTVLYSTYDIMPYLNNDANAVGIMLGNGRYVKDYGYDFPRLIAQLLIEYEDGSSDVIVTDQTWRTHAAPIRENGIYYGETYDARMEVKGWDEPGLNDEGWEAAEIVSAPGGKLISQAMPPIKVTKSFPAVRLTNPMPGVYIYDFGQNFTGWVRLQVQGSAGTTVKLRFSELLYDDGTLNVNVNRNAQATDTYTLKGEGIEVYEPRFTYHGFRYVEMTGFPGTPSLDTLEGRFLHTAVEPTGGFECSNQLLNNIHRNIIYGQLSNLMSVPTDCPQRDERMGWMGDAQLVAEEAGYNFDMAAFWGKYLDDIKDCQKEDGSVSDVVPAYWPIYPADPAWGTAYISIAWELYRFYGDVTVLERHYDSMKRWVDFLTAHTDESGLVNYYHYGEWCAPGSIPPKNMPWEITSAFFYYHDALMLSQIARLLGKDEDAESYRQLSGNIKDAFNNKFLNAEHGCYSFSSQTCNVLGLQFDIVPEDKEKTVVDVLLRQVIESWDYHFDTGIIGTKYILDTLAKYGYKDVAYKMMTQEDYPSFGYMIREGATTVWERWEKLTNRGMNSHNHIMFGTVDAWFYKDLAGIIPEQPGFKRVTVKPVVPSGLDHASASVKTVRGMVGSQWKRNQDSFHLEVTIPVNVTARVMVPKLDFDDVMVKENDVSVDSQNLSTCCDNEEEYFVFDVGSGVYTFEVERA